MRDTGERREIERDRETGETERCRQTLRDRDSETETGREIGREIQRDRDRDRQRNRDETDRVRDRERSSCQHTPPCLSHLCLGCVPSPDSPQYLFPDPDPAQYLLPDPGPALLQGFYSFSGTCNLLQLPPAPVSPLPHARASPSTFFVLVLAPSRRVGSAARASAPVPCRGQAHGDGGLSSEPSRGEWETSAGPWLVVVTVVTGGGVVGWAHTSPL